MPKWMINNRVLAGEHLRQLASACSSVRPHREHALYKAPFDTPHDPIRR